MSFPSQAGNIMLAFALHDAQTMAGSTKTLAASIKTRSSTGNITAAEIIAFHGNLKRNLDRLNEIKDIPGLPQYAKDQFDDQAFDIVVEFAAMITEIDATLEWVRANLPTSVAGFVESILLETDATQTDKVFTAGQTATLRTQLDLLVATIN